MRSCEVCGEGYYSSNERHTRCYMCFLDKGPSNPVTWTWIVLTAIAVVTTLWWVSL